MDIKITITSPDLHDAILALAAALETAGVPLRAQESMVAFGKAHDAAIDETRRMNAPWAPDVNAASSAATPVDNWVPQVQYTAVPPPAAQREPQTPPAQPPAAQPPAAQPPAAQPPAAQPPAAQPPMTAPPQPMTAPTKEFTLQEIAIWAVALQERDLPRLRAILAAFGIQALTQLPKEQYAAFVDALRLEGVVTDAR